MDDDSNMILPNLYIGNSRAAQNLGNLFTMVVNCTPDLPFHPDTKTQIRIPVYDDPNHAQRMYNYILQTNVLDKIHEEIRRGGHILVHCHQGMQRSCAIVACYLVKYYNVHPNQAVQYIQSKRRIAFYTGVNFKETILTVYNRTQMA